uniref:telomere length regulation protein TEL2 homolog n=1 Tax=Fragaria vesca subsp. vesca TaxID=101020 RepID=UPI0005CB3CCB|nr:PREDICTED: telomere length regulation protein TEL2 homolog [Fragaria vesca subsp. vesca]
MENGSKRRIEVEIKVLDKVGEVISELNKAKHADQVISALHSLAVLLFPLDPSLFSGAVGERCREQVLSVAAPSAEERSEWWKAFYRGAAFRTFARVLLTDVASNWLACFPFSARKHVYDVFFVNGLVTEVVQVLVPCLQQSGSSDVDVNAVQSNTERLLVLSLLENKGVLQMAREFGGPFRSEENLKSTVSRVAQIVASIPDKAKLRAPTSLSSHLFFKEVTIQLLSLAEEGNLEMLDEGAFYNTDMNWTLLFVGETFSRICRRGSVGLSLEQMSKEELDETKDVMQSILQGVSCRLQSPNHIVRKMASSVALVFSKVIDPKNPLYLDDSLTEETIDWEFGLSTPKKGAALGTSSSLEEGIKDSEISTTSVLGDGLNHKTSGKSKSRKLSEPKVVDPDEIIDPVILNYDSVSDEDDNDDVSVNSDVSSDSSLQPYDLSDDDADLKRKFSQLVDVVAALRKSDDADGVEKALEVSEKLVRASPDELKFVASDLVRTLVQVRCSDLAIEGVEDSAEDKRQRTLVALLVTCPVESLETLNKLLYSPNVDISQRLMILDVMTEGAQELADTKIIKAKHQTRALISTTSETQAWFLPSDIGPPGAGAWKEISETNSLLNWTNRYERELPPNRGQIRRGKIRQWSLRSTNARKSQIEWSHNKFPVYAAAFMLPAMQGFDKRRQGVDLLDRDFIVLGKLIYMLGVCMKCAAMHPEASALAGPLLDMLSSREICFHKEAYVRRSTLFAASCVLLSLHPSYVATSLVEGNTAISNGLEWVRTWALHVTESDTDRECYSMAMTCLQLHAEMALQASRALESAQSTSIAKNVVGIPSNLSKGTIIIPHSNVQY